MAEPLIDRDTVESIVEDCGPELLVELRNSLRVEADRDLAALGAAIAAGDADGAQRLLHAVRGASLNLGFSAFAAVANELEVAARAGSTPKPADQETLRSLLEASLAEIDRFAV